MAIAAFGTGTWAGPQTSFSATVTGWAAGDTMAAAVLFTDGTATVSSWSMTGESAPSNVGTIRRGGPSSTSIQWGLLSNVTGTGSKTITATVSASVTGILVVWRLTGRDTAGAYDTENGSGGTSTSNTCTATASGNGTDALSILSTSHFNPGSVSGWTARTVPDFNQEDAADLADQAAGSISAAWTWGGATVANVASMLLVKQGPTAPTFTAQPVGSAAAVGATTTYSVTSPDATSYQWQVSTNGGETWANVSAGSGGTTATYTTPAATAADNGLQYRCRATNSSGSTDSLGAWFHVSGLGNTGRGRWTARERQHTAGLLSTGNEGVLVVPEFRQPPGSGHVRFDDFAEAFRDLYFYADPVPPVPPPLYRVAYAPYANARNRPGSGPLSLGKFYVSSTRPKRLDIASADVSLALTGVSATGQVGDLGDAIAYGLSGVSATGAVGTVSDAVSYTLSGVAATGAVGSVAGSISYALTGTQASGAAGSVVASLSYAVTGNEATGAVGTVSTGNDVTLGITGVAATGALGSLSPALSVSLTGVLGTGQLGSVTSSPSYALTGAQASGNVGSLADAISYALTGVSASGEIGTPAVPGDVTRAITGVQAAGQVGSLSAFVGSDSSGADGSGKPKRRRRLYLGEDEQPEPVALPEPAPLSQPNPAPAPAPSVELSQPKPEPVAPVIQDKLPAPAPVALASAPEAPAVSAEIVLAEIMQREQEQRRRRIERNNRAAMAAAELLLMSD